MNNFNFQWLVRYTGTTCTVNIDYCNPNTCVDDGTCTDLVDDFVYI